MATTYLSKPALAAKAQASHLGGQGAILGNPAAISYDLCAFSSVPGTTNQTTSDSFGLPLFVCKPSLIQIARFPLLGFLDEKYFPAVGVRSNLKLALLLIPFRKIQSDSLDASGNTGHGEASIAVGTLGISSIFALGTKIGSGQGAAEAIDPIYFDQATVIDNYNPIIKDIQI